MTKPKQLDLSDRKDLKTYEHTDIYTGEIFKSRAKHHYEAVDPKPFAPPLDLPRPTLRQRVENLLNREGPGVMSRYVQDGTDDSEYEIPDDAETPLTPSERNYLDMVASDIAERAPFPDDGLPWQTTSVPTAIPPAQAGGAEGGGTQAAPPDAPKPGNSPASQSPAAGTVPTR